MEMVLFGEKLNRYQATPSQYKNSELLGKYIPNSNSVANYAVNTPNGTLRLAGIQDGNLSHGNELAKIANGKAKVNSVGILNQHYSNYAKDNDAVEPFVFEDMLLGGGGLAKNALGAAVSKSGQALSKSLSVANNRLMQGSIALDNAIYSSSKTLGKWAAKHPLATSAGVETTLSLSYEGGKQVAKGEYNGDALLQAGVMPIALSPFSYGTQVSVGFMVGAGSVINDRKTAEDEKGAKVAGEVAGTSAGVLLDKLAEKSKVSPIITISSKAIIGNVIKEKVEEKVKKEQQESEQRK